MLWGRQLKMGSAVYHLLGLGLGLDMDLGLDLDLDLRAAA